MTASVGGLTRRTLLASAGATLALAIGGATTPNNSAGGAALHFFAIGDWGDLASENQRRVARALSMAAEATPPDFIISVGDNFYQDGVASVDDPKWQTVFENVYSDPALQCPWYSVLGNHDARGNIEAEMAYSGRDPRRHMPGRYYRVPMPLPSGSSAEFFFLDTNVMADRHLFDADKARSQLIWLQGALEASEARWKIVLGHHPVFSGGRHGSSMTLVRILKPLLDHYGVAAYLNGHDHDLQHIRVDDVHYLTSGGGASVRRSSRLPMTLFDIPALGFLSTLLSLEALEIAFVGVEGETLYHAKIPPRG